MHAQRGPASRTALVVLLHVGTSMKVPTAQLGAPAPARMEACMLRPQAAPLLVSLLLAVPSSQLDHLHLGKQRCDVASCSHSGVQKQQPKSAASGLRACGNA